MSLNRDILSYPKVFVQLLGFTSLIASVRFVGGCRDGARSVCGRINATDVCEEYWKYGSKLPRALSYFLGYLLSNFLTRPDFIAYKHQDAKNISRRICTGLGAMPVCFTVKNQEDYEKAKKYFQLIIFDSFIPKK